MVPAPADWAKSVLAKEEAKANALYASAIAARLREIAKIEAEIVKDRRERAAENKRLAKSGKQNSTQYKENAEVIMFIITGEAQEIARRPTLEDNYYQRDLVKYREELKRYESEKQRYQGGSNG